MKYRTGDELDVRLRVTRMADDCDVTNRIRARVVEGDWQSIFETFFTEEELDHGFNRSARPFTVGDRVRYRRPPIEVREGCIRALEGGEAWVKWEPDGVYTATRSIDLEHAGETP